jgi:hypothetical protein
MYIYLWMNGKIGLTDIRKQPMARYETEYSIGKYLFNRNHCSFEPIAVDGDTLVVSSLPCGEELPPEGFVELGVTNFDDGTPAFKFFANTEATLDGKLNNLFTK